MQDPKQEEELHKMATTTASVLCLLLFAILCTAPLPASSAKCDPTDKKALIRIKEFWGNPYHLASWTNTTGCCAWYGVDCDATTSRVIGLSIFADTNLTGTLPPAVGDLPHLRSLDIRKLPNIVGPIVPDIARLSNLTFLRLDWNGLSGPVPSFLAALKNLEYLNLSFNRLSGAIPAALSSLLRLGYIRLDRNQLTGSIPDSFGRLPDGVYLLLGHNSLTGPVPRSLGGLNFTQLDLSRNQLTGDPSFLFGGAPKTTALIDLSRNAFQFDLTPVVFPPSLTWLDLNHNGIYGTIPPQIATLELQFLNVSYNRLCGEIPTGGNMGRFDASVYIHNRCLCGTPLPPCK